MSATHPMTLPRQGTTLVIVDVQERLFPAMDADHREEVMRNIEHIEDVNRDLRLNNPQVQISLNRERIAAPLSTA